MDDSNIAYRPPVFPPLIDALRSWRRADEAFLHARSPVERGRAMVEQLQARCVIHRLSEIELLIEHPLRAMLVEECVWSPREALDRLDVVDFAARHHALQALAPVLPAEWLGCALDRATRPDFDDDARWEADEELVQELIDRMTRASAHEHEPDAAQAAVIVPRDVAPPPTAERGGPTLEHILHACRANGRDEWIEPSFEKALEYVEDHLEPQHVAELAQDRANPRFVELRRALLERDHDLWSRPWFQRVFDAEERREYLRRVVERRERREEPCFDALLQIAQRLPPAPRATVLRWAVEERKRRGDTRAPVDLARVAALAEGEERAALIATIERGLDELDTDDRLTTIATLMPGVTLAEVLDLARLGLGQIAMDHKAEWTGVETFLAAIPSPSWAGLGRMDWEPALRAGGRNWVSYDVRLLALPGISEEARRLLEERGLPVLLEKEAYGRLETGAKIIHALSLDGRAQLIASLLPLDAVTWRKAASAVGPIARYLDDDDLERLCRTLHDPDPKRKWRAEASLAEAWAARGRLDRTPAIIERITDDDQRVEARVAAAIAAGDASTLLSLLDPSLSLQVYRNAMNAVVRWASEGKDSIVADTLAARVDEHLSPSDRLDAWAVLWLALSAHARADLAPRIVRAIEDVLTENDLHDDALCEIAEILPEPLLERIWMARASASAYRHALALFENRFCEFMLPDNHRHPCILHFVQALGGEEALFEHARSLAGRSPGSSALVQPSR